jgi:RNA polymerase sigma-70 factor (ECF subfamily)
MTTAATPISCKEVVAQLTDYLDHALPPDQVMRIEAHLTACGGCEAFLSQMQQTMALLPALADAPVPPETRAALQEAFRRWQSGDGALVLALRQGDEAAFMRIVEQYQGPLLRLAQSYVADRAVAEEVVQETWLGVLKGIHAFAGRSSFKTWLFHILANIARTRAVREGRTVPFSALAASEDDEDAALVPEDRFLPPDDPRAPNHWAAPPRRWETQPETHLLAGELRDHIQSAILALPPNQRVVITLRDIEGWPSEEVCAFLGVTEANQRVLLHRARCKVRAALDRYLAEG